MILVVDIDGVLLSAHETFGQEMLEDTEWVVSMAISFDPFSDNKIDPPQSEVILFA